MYKNRTASGRKNAVQRIESGARFVTDIELAGIAKVLSVTCDELLKSE